MTGVDWLPVGLHHDVTMADYLVDPSKKPSLTAHLAHLLVAASPKHAWTASPRLNPDFERVEEERFDLGTVVHALFLQGLEIAETCDFPDWRTNAAKEARDTARAEGKIPLLAKHWQRCQDMVEAIRGQVADLNVDPPMFAVGGTPEQTLIWEDEGGVMCRARLDWLHSGLTIIDDLKTCPSAQPLTWARRTLWSIGADVQVAFHLRGLEAVAGTHLRPFQFRYLLAETSPPYAVSVVTLRESALELGRQKVEKAVRRWRECLAVDFWPTYQPAVYEADAPDWEMARFLEAQYDEEEVAA